MTTLVTFLGTGNYKPLNYKWEGDSCLTRYVAKALERFHAPGEVRILATETALSAHGAALRAELSAPARTFSLPEGADPDSLRDQFAVFLEALEVPRDRPLIVDITHGFRAQPFFAATALAALQAAGRLPAETRIVYGAAPTPPTEGAEAPIWELTPFLHRLQEAFGVIIFQRTGDAGLLIEALKAADRRLRSRLRKQGGDPGALQAKGLVQALKRFSTEMQLLRIPALTIGIGDSPPPGAKGKKRRRESSSLKLREALAAYGAACRDEHPVLALLLEEIEEQIAPLECETLADRKGHEALLHLARLFLERGQYAEAANVAREGLVTLYADGPEGTDATRSVFSKEARRRAETRFTSIEANRKLVKIRNILEHCDFREYKGDEVAQALSWNPNEPEHPLEGALEGLINEFERQIREGPRKPTYATAPRTLFVTRHGGAREWAARQGLRVDEFLAHLDPRSINPGDLVIGSLPVHLVAEICRRGGRYKHLSMQVPPEARGRELTAEEMERYGARLEEFRVTRPDEEDE